MRAGDRAARAARRGAALDRHVARPPSRARRSRRAPRSSTTSRRFAAIPRWPRWSRSSGVDVCLMHMQGEPRTMQDDPRYEDVVSEVKSFLEERLAFAIGGRNRRAADLARPGDRLRQDAGAQPRAAAAAGRDRGDRPAGRGRRLEEALHRRPDRSARGRAARRQPGRGRDRLRARRRHAAGPRRREPPGMPLLSPVLPWSPGFPNARWVPHRRQRGLRTV